MLLHAIFVCSIYSSVDWLLSRKSYALCIIPMLNRQFWYHGPVHYSLITAGTPFSGCRDGFLCYLYFVKLPFERTIQPHISSITNNCAEKKVTNNHRWHIGTKIVIGMSNIGWQLSRCEIIDSLNFFSDVFGYVFSLFMLFFDAINTSSEWTGIHFPLYYFYFSIKFSTTYAE